MKTRIGKSYALNGDFIVLELPEAKVVKSSSTPSKEHSPRLVPARGLIRARHRGTKPRKTHRRKSKRSRVTRLRRWARRSLARRFVPVESRLDPNKVLLAGIALPSRPDGVQVGLETSSRVVRRSKLDELVGLAKPNAAAKKRLLRVSREILNTLGVAVVGRIPMRVLEIIWEHVGERVIAPHGMACWCQQCRSHAAVHRSLLSRTGDAVLYYLQQMPLRVTLKWLVLAPIRTAQFVSNKLWRWLNILCDDVPAKIADVAGGCKVTEEEWSTLSNTEIRKLIMDRGVEDADRTGIGWLGRLMRHMRRRVVPEASGSE
jgi:hypothetical protein